MQIKEFFNNSIKRADEELQRRIGEIEDEFIELENEMVDHQKQELETLHSQLENTLPIEPKMSSELLKLRREYQGLAKQKNYAAAAEKKHRATELQQLENEKWEKTRAGRITSAESSLILKHKKERNTHNRRMQGAIDEAKKERDKKVKQLSQNYLNTDKQAANAHTIELAHLSKVEKKGGSFEFEMSRNKKGSISSRGKTTSIKH